MTTNRIISLLIQATIALALISVTTSGSPISHDLEPRAVSDKLDAVESVGSSPARIIQRHLSPHRMMHFGKRPIVRLAPAIAEIPSSLPGIAESLADDQFGSSASTTFDLYGSPLKQRRSPPDYSSLTAGFPYLMELEFGNGQILQELPDDRMLIPDVTLVSGPAGTSYNLAANQQQQRARMSNNGQQLMKLVESVVEQQQQNQKANQVETSMGLVGSQEPKRDIATRSPHLSKNRAFRFPDLVGVPGALSPSLFGLLDKKAEPKDNFFMHFG